MLLFIFQLHFCYGEVRVQPVNLVWFEVFEQQTVAFEEQDVGTKSSAVQDGLNNSLQNKITRQIPHYDNRKMHFILHSSLMCKNARSSPHPDIPGTFTFDQFEVLAQVGAVAYEAHFEDFHHPPAFIPRLRGHMRVTWRRRFPWQCIGVTWHLYTGSTDYQLCGEKYYIQAQARLWCNRGNQWVTKYENMKKKNDSRDEFLYS